MELYIEKEFLDNFYLEYRGTQVQDVVKSLIEDYGSKEVFMDLRISDVNHFEKLKSENPFFAMMCSKDKPPTPVGSLKSHILNQSTFEQAIVFADKEGEWFFHAQEKGALCFSFESYEKSISDIIKFTHFKIDLSGSLNDWGFIGNYKYLNYNSILINDNYILADKSTQKISLNLMPLLHSLLGEIKSEVSVNIFTRELGSISSSLEHKKEKAKKAHRKLNSFFANSKIKFSIIMNNLNPKMDMHDRNILTNFSLLESGVGFNLFPEKPSNSQIISSSVFEKYTYDRLGRLLDEHKKYLSKLDKLDTLKFKKFPA